jgi:hypothetical protein
MRYLSAVCFLAIVAFADASPAAAQQNCACFAEFKAKAAEGVGLTCRVVILVPALGPATMGPCVATIVVPPASPLDGARRARILSGNIIGQPSSRGSATFRSSSSPELRSRLASHACGQACARFRPGGVGEQETVEGRGPILRLGGE